MLVFLPGWDEIMRLKERLETSFPASRYTYYFIVPETLVDPVVQHGGILSEECSIESSLHFATIAGHAVAPLQRHLRSDASCRQKAAPKAP